MTKDIETIKHYMKILLEDAERDRGRGETDFRKGFLLAAERACRICGFTEDEIKAIGDEAYFGRRVKVGDIVNIGGKKMHVEKVDEPDRNQRGLYKTVDTTIDLREDDKLGIVCIGDRGLDFDEVSGEFTHIDVGEARKRGMKIWEH